VFGQERNPQRFVRNRQRPDAIQLYRKAVAAKSQRRSPPVAPSDLKAAIPYAGACAQYLVGYEDLVRMGLKGKERRTGKTHAGSGAAVCVPCLDPNRHRNVARVRQSHALAAVARQGYGTDRGPQRISWIWRCWNGGLVARVMLKHVGEIRGKIDLRLTFIYQG